VIKRTLYFGNPAYLSRTKDQLVVNYPDNDLEKTMPIEDIGVVVLDHYQLTISQPLISSLLSNNVALITCNERHLPQGLMLNLDGHHTQQAHFTAQIEATSALKDRLWKQVVRQKILNQGALLQEKGEEVKNMKYWAGQVKNGDPQNMEGRAAANYWKKLFDTAFIRGRYEGGPNALLNYGYAILRAVVARSLVGSGLHPSLGIHHHNKYNAYCLADDMMEAYRPFVDRLVLEIMETEEEWEELSWDVKSILLTLPTLDVLMKGKFRPLMVAMQQTTASLAACYLKEKKKLKLPEWTA
jgi:CRISPR-associated protein Cas1